MLQHRSCPSDDHRMTENLLRAAELTDLCLELRCAQLRKQYSPQEVAKRVMGEIRLAKEQVWHQSPF